MGSLSINNLIVSIGVAFDAQLKAADNLFFSAAVDFTDPTRPQFGGPIGIASGASVQLYGTGAVGYTSANNPVSGDPVTVRSINTSEGPRYQITDANGREIKIESQSVAGGTYKNIPRYLVKSDGIVYDVLAPVNPNGTGGFGIGNPLNPNGTPSYSSAAWGARTANDITLANYAKPVGRITFKAKEGATLARAQDDLQRVGSIVQLLTRLLESVQDEAKGFSSLIR